MIKLLLIASLVTNFTGYATHRDITPSSVVTTDPYGTVTNVMDTITKMNEKEAWVRPNEWMVNVALESTNQYQNVEGVDIDSYRYYSNRVATTFYGGKSAQCSAISIDELSMEPPVIAQWAALDGGEITTNGYFSATNDGIYRVSAKDQFGVMRYADVAISDGRVESTTNHYCYFADMTGTARKVVNDEAYTILTNATFISSNVYYNIHYSLYKTFKPNFVGKRQGNVSQAAISQHILISAAHYGEGIRWLIPQTFIDSYGNEVTVNKLKWIDLESWAITNSFTEVEAKNAFDIAMIICDKSTAIPDNCIPYLIDKETADEFFGGTWDGTTAWLQGQDHDYAIPGVLSVPPTLFPYSASLHMLHFHPDIYDNLARLDIRNRLVEMGPQYYAHGGDSGKPMFLMYKDKPILAGIVRVAGPNGIGGPDVTGAYNIIKKFVESYGDTIKNIKEAR